MSENKLNLETVNMIAKLAKLSISPDQTQEHLLQLNKIMGFFDKISEVATDKIEPLVTPIEVENSWREDKVENNFTAQEMVQNAPSKQGSLFKVPPVV